MDFILDTLKVLVKGGKVFHQRKGMTLASSSSFYALITIVPFMLLMIRGIGFFLGSVNRSQKYLFSVGTKFFPEIAPDLMLKIQTMVKGPLFADTSFTALNFIFFAIATFTFINSLWMGVFFITEDRSVLSWWRILKAFAVLGITMLMMGMIFILPPIVIYTLKFVQTNFVTQFLWENIDILRPYLKYLMTVNVKKSYWLNSNFLHLSILLTYFTILYRWLFSWKISLRESFVAALAFSVSMFIGKYIFWIYIYYVRSGLMQSYGDLYTSVAGVIWVFYLMCFFFYGACICHVFKERRDELRGSDAIN